MQDIINWLLKVEHMAGKLYADAAARFKDDHELSALLDQLAEDEAWHYHTMASASEHLRLMDAPPSIITVDPETRRNIEVQFQQVSRRLSDGTLTEEQLHHFVITIEFSEWNDIFLYIVNLLKEKINEFKYVATRLQQHKRSIELYFEKYHGEDDRIKKFQALPAVWLERILIIEDDETVAELLKAILAKEGRIDVVGDGKAGLDKIRANYYKLILSDIDMPVMDGIQCFTHAREIFPDINDRYLFFTGGLHPDRIDFFNRHHVRYLGKPSPISQILKTALDILLYQSPAPVNELERNEILFPPLV